MWLEIRGHYESCKSDSAEDAQKIIDRMAEINPTAAQLFLEDKQQEWSKVIKLADDAETARTAQLMKVLVAEGSKLEEKAAAENNANILPPAAEDPLLARTLMIKKLLPVVKRNYDESEPGHQQ